MPRRLAESRAAAAELKMKAALLLPLAVLAGCASVPTGPSVMVLPGSAKSFDQFRFDDYECRQYASHSVGGTTSNQASIDSGVQSAVVGAAVGTIAGAALGGSRGAIAGAGIGTAGGALAGAGSGSQAGRTIQQRYDIGYQQCMYAKGHQIPMAGRFDRPASRPNPAVPPPPPPAGTPPPPPPAASATPPPPPPPAASTTPPPPAATPPASAPPEPPPS